MRFQQPYHEGELQVQERLGEINEGARNGRAIGDRILAGAVKFIRQQPMALLGSTGAGGDVWASVLFGPPGFLDSADTTRLTVDLADAVRVDSDPFWTNVESRRAIGVLLIELVTRRRLRINGTLESIGDSRLELAVDQSYPNCPKYIQRRHLKSLKVEEASGETNHQTGTAPTDAHRSVVSAADTFFVASAHPDRGVDVSHRGGEPGFVRWIDAATIRVPDYVGNSMYNTLGNLVVDPRSGLLFFDFERARTLQLTGRAEVQWQLDDPENETGGTKRYWDFRVERWVETALPLSMEWDYIDASPHNPRSGSPNDG